MSKGIWQVYFASLDKFSELDKERFMGAYAEALASPDRTDVVLLNYLGRKYKLGVSHLNTGFAKRVC